VIKILKKTRACSSKLPALWTSNTVEEEAQTFSCKTEEVAMT
jgi:hypothetical protein